MNEQELNEAHCKFLDSKYLNAFGEPKFLSSFDYFKAGHDARQPEIDERDKRIAELESSAPSKEIRLIGVADKDGNRPDITDAAVYIDTVALLRARVKELEVKLREAKKDTERMDYVERWKGGQDHDGGYAAHFSFGVQSRRTGQYAATHGGEYDFKTIREAIDKELKGEK